MKPDLMLEHEYLQQKRWWQRLQVQDVVFACAVLLVAVWVQCFAGNVHMDVYDAGVLWLSVISGIALAWFFRPLQAFALACTLLFGLAWYAYGGDFERSQTAFVLQYFVASQSAMMWLCVCNVLAFVCYVLALLQAAWRPVNQNTLSLSLAIALSWAGAVFGMVGLLVRWHESYLLRPEAGHMPVSNLYEVFILFMVMMALMFLYYARRHQAEKLGAFVYALMVVLVAFVLWYSAVRGAHQIQPLIPALQSWWMKIHVPANFVGYGAFCIAAVLGVAQLWVLKRPEQTILPDANVIDEIMYRAIAVGFLFFTIATVLGALWAAEAWGRYWSWDPKETWALIVWLNYAVWLHLRLVSGWRGRLLAWWAIVGFFITAFAFLGVNMLLSGLHSYGSL
ncbi:MULTISPECIES: c-type cytochrome biogenesis protein CcsB [Vitreoscilla]|uniref:C-type cytochrome biogenesis protein CcsB n=1 Tax=Vitreoscilla stercoraria TaxID=61 RepID=A0ABY4EBE5_VITST|nr:MULTISPECIES: c-type cytochrome biogenesis protein CcsB [Vitreoscilla]AUZ06011.2 cytochrome c biogenesis protein CcsA [Vitreoscilla sp. C1]UOO92616.1 c-type cytochrome biogenesis protein CcsB [Vitreoscilla stercoraria]